jgi:DNA-directed RNA polymerase subunit M/transcription elongation factor TFIIS
MSAVNIAQQITTEFIENNDVLYGMYEICNKEFKKKKTANFKVRTSDICDFLQSIVEASVEKALSEQIYTDWRFAQFISLLNGIFRHTMQNLESTDSWLWSSIIKGDILWRDVAKLSPFAKNPDIWKAIKIALALREQESNMKVITHSDKKCYKCGKNEVFSLSRQTRSADEPETHFYTCLNCDNKWRTSG